MIPNAKLYNYEFSNLRTYMFAALFVGGNIVLPQLTHLIPQGGLIFLPIYFFTLIAAYKFGFAAGLLTAVFSPIINNLWFGMPPNAVLPLILFKSIVLALSAAFIASKIQKVSFWSVLSIVLFYQTAGILFETIYLHSIKAALQDFIIGYPGIILQIVGGYFLIKVLSKI